MLIYLALTGIERTYSYTLQPERITMTLQTYQQPDKDNRTLKQNTESLNAKIIIPNFIPKITTTKKVKNKESNVIRAVLPYGTHYSIVKSTELLANAYFLMGSKTLF